MVGVYLNALIDDGVVLKTTGKFVSYMVQTDPGKYVRIRNGKKGLYLRVVKALYGCTKLGILWYTLFSETL